MSRGSIISRRHTDVDPVQGEADARSGPDNDDARGRSAVNALLGSEHRSRKLVRAFDRESWSALVGQSVFPFDIDMPNAGEFFGSIRSTRLFDLSLLSVRSQLHAAHRAVPQLRATAEEQLVFSLQRSGTLRLRQFEQETVVRAGEFVIYTSTEPVMIEGSDDYNSLSIEIPVSRSRQTADRLKEVTARSFSAQEGIAPAVWSLVDQLEAGGGQLPTANAALIAHHVIGLAEQMLHRDAEPDSTPASGGASGEAILEDCWRYIENHLGDPDLCPVRIAEANFISTRYLHALFQRTETTVSGYIRFRRLQRARELLADPALAGVPVESLARQVGFHNVSYFGQVFKKATGLTPARYRQQVMWG